MVGKKKFVLLGIVAVVVAAVFFSLLLLFNPAFSLSMSGKTVIYSENVTFENTDYRVYVTEKDGELGITAYINDGFLSSPREAGLGTSDENYAHYILGITGVKNERPFVDTYQVYAVKNERKDLQGEVISDNGFEYNGESYRLIYLK